MVTVRVLVQVDGRGRILLPRAFRSELEIEPKGHVTAELQEDGAIRLSNPRAERRRLIAEARGSFAGRGTSVDELIAERRSQARREAENS